MRAVIVGLTAFVLAYSQPGFAQQQSKVPPLPQTKMMMNVAKDQLVAFRNWDGRQLIYLTNLLVHHCNLKSISYSINSDTLDQQWPVPECIEQLPYNLDPEKDKIYLSLELGAAQSIAVQAEFGDGSASPTYVFEPCEGVSGDQTCGYLAKTVE